jgi:hypothetical protein
LTTIACLIASSTWRVCIEQNRGIDLSRLGINGRMVEKPGQAAKKLLKTPTDILCIEMSQSRSSAGGAKSQPARFWLQIHPHVSQRAIAAQ